MQQVEKRNLLRTEYMKYEIEKTGSMRGKSRTWTARAIGLTAVIAAMMLMAGCQSDELRQVRLTQQQKQEIASTIAGEYSGSYIILWADSTTKTYVDEDGAKKRPMKKERFEGVAMTVTDGGMQSVFFHRFPISMLSRVVDDNEPLRQALAEAPDMDLTARYGLGLYTDQETVVWGLEDMTAGLTLRYGGREHHIVLPIRESGTRWLIGKMKAGERVSLRQAGSVGFTFTAIVVDGETAVTLDSTWDDGNSLIGMFRIDQENQ